MVGRKLHQRDPEAISTRILETLVSYLGHSSENEIYGNRKILCEYASVDSKSLVFGRIQHGWVHMNNQRTLIKNDLVDTYLWSDNSRQFCINRGLSRIHSIGSPWLYLLEISKRLGWRVNLNNDSERSIDELWIYGAHSTKTPKDNVDVQLQDFLEAADKSQAKNKSVLLYYIDYFHLTHEAKSRYPNLQFLTALGGRLHSSTADAHLYILYWLLNNCKTVVFDVPTSALLYAVTMDCKISWHKNSNHITILNDSIMRNDDLLTALMSFEGAPSQMIKVGVGAELGFESLKTPEEIRQLFNWNISKISKFRRLYKSLYYFCTLPFKLGTLRAKA